MAKKTTHSLKTETSVGANTKGFDILFMIGWIVISFFLSPFVDKRLYIPYGIFTTSIAFYLTRKSKLNKGRRNFESIYFLLTKDKFVYRPYYRRNKDDI